MGLDEAAHSVPVRRSENDTHAIVESDTDDATVDATVPKRTTSWFFNNFKTPSPLPNRLNRRPVPKKAIKKGKTRARVS
jgi:hypothetical protein